MAYVEQIRTVGTLSASQQFYIKNINSNNAVITVIPNGTELIDGYANLTIGYYNTMIGVLSTGQVIF